MFFMSSRRTHYRNGVMVELVGNHRKEGFRTSKRLVLPPVVQVCRSRASDEMRCATGGDAMLSRMRALQR